MAVIVDLAPHPSTPYAVPASCTVALTRADNGDLRLCYTLRGPVAGLRVPTPRPPAAADGLWAHTCCEAFVGRPGSPAYREFNFSPSGEWAIYDFAAYRQRAAAATGLPAPRIVLQRAADALVLDVQVAAAALPDGRPLALGLAAVVESADGTLSYWALRHPAERPDFHHRDAFALTLPAQP